jgi:hypothetical protein
MAQGDLSDSELEQMEALIAGASPAPWESFVEGRDQFSGDDFIRMGGLRDDVPDMYVSHEADPAPAADLDFIAAARNYLPRLVAEVRRRRHSA